MYEVLIVEDDPMVAMLNKQYTNQNPHFHVAQVVNDGTSAWEYLTKNTIHLVILDVYMSQIDGLALLRKIREHNLNVSVIMVTAANDTTTVEESFRLGITDYLVKPFYNARFQQALETFRSRQDAFHDLSSFSQVNIDSIINTNSAKSSVQLPKGIVYTTLEIICNFLENDINNEYTGEEIADKVNLSRVTVKRYMNYLLEEGKILGRMNYETGGRPCMLYKWNIK
ncbi:MAG: response regulator [Clostridiales bacterium]|nr:response regulator [Clostridiales bacterium]